MTKLEPTRTNSDLTATERLRALLDERGVEHFDGTESTLWGYESYNEVTGIYRFSADETSDGYMQVRLWHATPEQAIAATLGREDTYTREDVESAFVSGYSLGSLPVGSDPQWNENRQTVDEHMAELGWVRKATLGSSNCTNDCTNSERTGMCHPIISDNLAESEGTGDAWADCSECGHLLFVLTDPTSEPPNYCPNCGRKVVEPTTNDVDAEVGE